MEERLNRKFSNPYEVVELFEQEMAQFCGAPFGVACDSSTHAIELCLIRNQQLPQFTVPKRTYLSVPMTLKKLGKPFKWSDEAWKGQYHLGNGKIFDCSLRLKKDMYIPKTTMCLSFQFRKRLPIGRGGMILLDSAEDYRWYKKAVHDGRTPGTLWKQDPVDMLGYHYYMTPDDAARGLLLYYDLPENLPDLGGHLDYPDLTTLPVFKNDEAE